MVQRRLDVIVVIERNNAARYANLLDKMFRLRARVFHDTLKWDVHVADGKERDRYDDAAPVYIVYTDEKACEVKGSLRLLPTTGPTLLTDVFADTMPDGLHLRAPTIWECTRFCVDDGILARQGEHVFFASAVLLIALGDSAVKAGIESIIGNFHESVLRFFRLMGCEVDILGSTSRYGEPVYLGLHPISATVIGRIRKNLKIDQTVFSQARLAAA
jgi:acyl homoserine lactone synthase